MAWEATNNKIALLVGSAIAWKTSRLKFIVTILYFQIDKLHTSMFTWIECVM